MSDKNEAPEFDAGEHAEKFWKEYREKESEEKLSPRPPKKPILLKEPLIVYPEKPPVPPEDIAKEIAEGWEEPWFEGMPISRVLANRWMFQSIIGEGVRHAEELIGKDLEDRGDVKELQSKIIRSALRMLTMPELPKQKDEEIERLRLKVRQVFKPTEDAMLELEFNFKKLKELLEMPEKERKDKGLI